MANRNRPNVICAKCGKKKARKIMTPTPLNKALQAISIFGLFGIFILSFAFNSFYIVDLFFFPIFVSIVIAGMIPGMLDYKRGKFTLNVVVVSRVMKCRLKVIKLSRRIMIFELLSLRNYPLTFQIQVQKYQS